jgi:hypothetical protein
MTGFQKMREIVIIAVPVTIWVVGQFGHNVKDYE